MSHENCSSIWAGRNKSGHIVCIGFNLDGVKGEPEDVITICFHCGDDDLEVDEKNRIATVDPRKTTFGWSMTREEAREVAEQLVKTVDQSEATIVESEG